MRKKHVVASFLLNHYSHFPRFEQKKYLVEVLALDFHFRSHCCKMQYNHCFLCGLLSESQYFRTFHWYTLLQDRLHPIRNTCCQGFTPLIVSVAYGVLPCRDTVFIVPVSSRVFPYNAFVPFIPAHII